MSYLSFSLSSWFWLSFYAFSSELAPTPPSTGILKEKNKCWIKILNSIKLFFFITKLLITLPNAPPIENATIPI